MADCEFIENEWIGWLNERCIRYYIRISQSFWITTGRIRAWWLFSGLRIIRPIAMVCMALVWADPVGEHKDISINR